MSDVFVIVGGALWLLGCVGFGYLTWGGCHQLERERRL